MQFKNQNKNIRKKKKIKRFKIDNNLKERAKKN